ncbi:MAG: hypothetical protein ACLPLR_15520 [Terriglobales bacterium]
MNKFLAVVVLCLPAFGQAAYSGLGWYSGSATYGSCAAPNFCAYNGVDLIPVSTLPNVGGLINNGATVYDTSFLGHKNWNGTTFSSTSNLSPITRLTDQNSTGLTSSMITAGMGGAGYFTLTNTNTSLVSFVITGGAQALCRFNTATGFCSTGNWGGTYPSQGIFISTGQNGTCSVAQSQLSTGCPIADFGSVFFSRVNPNLIYVFGSTLNGVTSSTGLTNHKAVTPITVNPTTGAYSFGSTIVDFDYGLPLGNSGTGGCIATVGPETNAPCWTPSTSYTYGTYVTHPLSSSEMVNSGVWQSGYSYFTGDLVANNGTSTTCLYKVTAAGVSGGSVPPFLPSGCKGDVLTDGGVKWTGTASMAQFLYQDVTPGTNSSASSSFQWIASPTTLSTNGATTKNSAVVSSTFAWSGGLGSSIVGQAVSVSGAGNSSGTTPLYTTILSYSDNEHITLATPALATLSGVTVALTGHPDLMSSTVGDANGLVWVNVGPEFTPTGGVGWNNYDGVSNDSAYNGNPTYYAMLASTNSYGEAPKYNSGADQDTGIWAIDYDANLNIYHLLNTATGIWTDWSCSGGSGYNCSGGSWTGTTIGALQAITNPYGTGQACPQLLHGSYGFSRNGLYHQLVAAPANFYPACQETEYMMWQNTTSNFNAYSSLQYTAYGTAHAAMGTNYMFAQSSSGWGYNAGVFSGLYDARNAQGNCTLPSYTNCGNPVLTAVVYPSPFSVYLYPLASQGTAQTYPPGCYVDVGPAQKNPDCNIGDIFGSHMSWAGDPGTDTYPVCGTLYSEFTVNAWQNMEACMSTYPRYPTGYFPTPGGVSLAGQASAGEVWEFTHSFNTTTSTTFSTQYGVSEYSQDAQWLFWSSDWGCTLGSKTGAAPSVWSSGTYYQMLQVAWADPFTQLTGSPTSLCGWQWYGSTSYVAGNTINPIEGLTGTNQIDDVFQALTTGTSGPSTGAGTSSVNPLCGSVSCFAITNPPSTTAVSVTGATEIGTTGTITVSAGIQLNDGEFVTLAGFSPAGWNGTLAVTGAVGAGCPGTACSGITAFNLAGLPSGIGTPTALGTAASQGDTVCDLTTPGSDVLDPSPPYSSSCSPGVVWQDLGPQTQRGDVFAVNLATN